jgi:hypothetical protein
MRSIALPAALILSAPLSACGDGSEPFALQDGCYYAAGGQPILRVRGEEGTILTPEPASVPGGNIYTPIHRVRLNPRTGPDGA